MLTDDLQFVDPQHPQNPVDHRLLCAGRVVVEHVPDGLVVSANLSRDLRERALDAPLLDLGHQAARHLPLPVHRRQRVQQSLATGRAAQALTLETQFDALTVHGGVHEGLQLGTVPVQRAGTIVRAGSRLDATDCRDDAMGLMMLHAHHTDVRQVQNVMRRVRGVCPIRTIRTFN